METHANVSRPTRRRSFFGNIDDKSVDLVESEWKRLFGETSKSFEDKLYPQEYVEKLQTELEIMQDQQQEITNKKFEDLNKLYNMTCDENSLQSEEKEYLNSISSKVDEFVRTSQRFVEKVKIAQRIKELRIENIQHKTETLNRYLNDCNDESFEENNSC